MKKVLFIFAGLAISLCSFSQTSTNKNASSSNMKVDDESRNEIRVYYGDAIPLDLTDVLSSGVSGALTGLDNKESNLGMFGLGYRYKLNRFRFGADLGYNKGKTKSSFTKDTPTDFEQNRNQYLVIPTAEYTYLKKGIVELYGSAGAGALITKSDYKGKTTKGEDYVKSLGKKTTTDFAFQVNPIAVRVGNSRIAGFLEAGFGYKGFTTVGVSYRF